MEPPYQIEVYMEPRIDLRSDTVTRPTPAMRRAMADAEVGDDVFGEDPTVAALEARAAALFGKEAALLVPSGTMANQLAIHVHCRAGEEVLVGQGAHSLIYETGAGPALSGVQITPLPPFVFGQEELRAAYHDGGNVHDAPTRLIMVENTHNRGGGIIYPLEKLEQVRAFAVERGLCVHMDGARIFNAVVASGIAPERWGATVDTLSFCLSKGLGAPVGSLLVGGGAFIRDARRARKRFGGGMRQAGILAAAGLLALDHHIERLADDHRRAQRLAQAWDLVEGLTPDPWPETNILYLRVDRRDLSGPALAALLRERGILVNAVGARHIRAVTHLDLDDAGLERACAALSDLC